MSAVELFQNDGTTAGVWYCNDVNKEVLVWSPDYRQYVRIPPREELKKEDTND